MISIRAALPLYKKGYLRRFPGSCKPTIDSLAISI